MRNHFHLAVELTEPNLSEGMKWLYGTWIRHYNTYRRLIGRPFQGRYKALLVEPGHALAQVCHYVHLNPVRAKVVSPERVGEYRWSSLPRFLGKKRPDWLEANVLLLESGGLPDNRSGWRSYGEYLATDSIHRKELMKSQMSRGWCIGSKEFKESMRREAAERGAEFDRERFDGLEPDVLRQERYAAWEEQLQFYARKAQVDLARLPSRKSAKEKVLLAAAMKKSTSVSNAWLARRLEMGQPASASQFARRFSMTKEGARALEKLLLSRVKT